MLCILFGIINVSAYDTQSTLIEIGDDELHIAHFQLDTQAYDKNNLGVNEKHSGSGGLSTSKYNLPEKIDLSVVDGRYESGDNVFSTLEVSLHMTLLSKGGDFEYTLVSPSGVEYPIKKVKINNDKNKLLVYDLPSNAEDGVWTMKGELKFDGYKPIEVTDKFKVKNYTIYIWFLLAIIIISSMSMIIYYRNKRIQNNYKY